jgi:hypothetical protein
MQNIIIVYPRGDKTRLSFGICFDYEEDEYSIASRRRFSYPDQQKEALEYGLQLAKENNLEIDCSNLDNEYNKESNYLD